MKHPWEQEYKLRFVGDNRLKFEFKPCPMCGSKFPNIFIRCELEQVENLPDSYRYYCRCSTCLTQGGVSMLPGVYFNPEDVWGNSAAKAAVASWNMRVG